MEAFVHRLLPLIGALHFEEFHQRLDGDALEEDGEVDDGYGGRDEQRLSWNFLGVDEQNQGKSDGSTQSAVGHDKFLHVIQFMQTEAVGQFRQHDDTDGSEQRTEQNGQQDECRVPVVLVVDRVDAEEHENNRLRTAAQHLHGVFDGRVRFGRDVAFHVVFHRDAAERDPAAKSPNLKLRPNSRKVAEQTYARIPDMWKISAFK